MRSNHGDPARSEGWNIRGFCGTIRRGEPLRRCDPDGGLSARGALSDSPLPTGLGSLNQSLCEHWLVVGLLGVVFCVAVVLLFHG